MRVTLITACFNSAATLSTAIDSVLAQKDVDIEYIIVDGGSKDGTVDIIKEFASRSVRPASPGCLVIKWISEPDRGMYDHFPSAECHGESLTPATLFITDNMSETPVDGFDHNSNPVALAAGVYTVVLATYKSAVGEMGVMCGLGLVKTGDREAYVAPAEYAVESMDVAGAFEGWGTNPVVLTKTGNVFEGTITLAEEGEFKVRLNGEWKYSLGSGALANGAYADNDGNISKPAGTYLVHVELAAEAIANFEANKTIVSFTVSAVA